MNKRNIFQTKNLCDSSSHVKKISYKIVIRGPYYACWKSEISGNVTTKLFLYETEYRKTKNPFKGFSVIARVIKHVKTG